MSTLRLRRASEFANWLRAYQLVVDGVSVGKVRSGREVEVAIRPGYHVVELTIDWCRSNPIGLQVREGESCLLSCGSNYTGLALFRGVTRMMTDSSNYLWLREESSRAPA